jgi:DUF917 family protein
MKLDLQLIEAALEALENAKYPWHMDERVARRICEAEFGADEVPPTMQVTILQTAAASLAQQHVGHYAKALLNTLQEKKRLDPDEVHEVRVMIDQNVYVSGSVEDIVRTAFQAGYQRGKTDTLAGAE